MLTARRAWRTDLWVLVAYVVLALALTWPLAAHLGTHVPGNGIDDPPLTWNLWWVRHALLELGKNPFECQYLFYPIGINLAFYTLTVLNGMLSVPLQATLGLVAASNLVLLSSFVLSGYGAFLLARYGLAKIGSTPAERRHAAGRPNGRVGLEPASVRESPSHLLAAFVAGGLYAFASSKLFYAALGQWNIASSQWIPFFVLTLFRFGDEPGRVRHAGLAALFLLFQAYAEMTYASFLVLFTVLWVAWRVASIRNWATRDSRGSGIRRSQDPALRQLPPGMMTGGRDSARGGLGWPFARSLASVVVAAALVSVGLLPILVMMVPELRTEAGLLVEGGGFADVFSADLLGFLVPTMLHPALGGLAERFGFDHTVGQHLYLGYSVLALAAVGTVSWWRRAGWVRFWTVAAAFFWLLSLGPSLRVNGTDTGIPLPFRLVARLPFFEGNRYSSRYSVLLMLSLAMLTAFGLAALWDRLRLRAAAAGPRRERVAAALSVLLAATMLFEHLSVPLPMSDMRVPPVYDHVAAMPGDWTLLDLPVAWRNGFRVTGTQDPVIMFEQYYQTVHGKRILAGNTSRNPSFKFQYFTRAPVINTLIALETGHDVDDDALVGDRTLAPTVLRFFGIEAIVVHPDQAGPDVTAYVESVLEAERLWEDGATVLYRTRLAPWPLTWAVEPGSASGRLSLAEGWGEASDGVVWAQSRSARLLVPLDADGRAVAMSFRAYAPVAGMGMQIEVNGRPSGSVALEAGWRDYGVTIGAVKTGLNEVVLRFNELAPANQVRRVSRPIGETGAAAPTDIVVQSAGLEIGDFGRIWVGGRDVAPNERGYNVVVIHPESGAVEAAASFDTHLNEMASRTLAGFLDAVPAGRIVAVAAADEASRLLGREAVEALGGIGAAGDLRDKFRWGHAIIGVRGAKPGTAVESMGWMEPVSAVVGEGLTRPEAAAGFSGFEFSVRR